MFNLRITILIVMQFIYSIPFNSFVFDIKFYNKIVPNIYIY